MKHWSWITGVRLSTCAKQCWHNREVKENGR